MARAVTAMPRMPLNRWLRRRRVTRWALVAVLLLAGLTVWVWGGIHRQLPPAWLERGQVIVTQIQADLTLRVTTADGRDEAIVRLAGVSSDSMHPACVPWLRERCALGPLVLECAGTGVARVAGPWPVYAYDAAGRMINETIISEGMAKADATDHHRLAQWFGRLERTAKDRDKGMWKN